VPEFSLVVPMYNEEESCRLFFERVVPILNDVAPSFEIVCVNNGSSDRTLEMLLPQHARDPRIKIVDLSRNFGKELALTAGLDIASGRAVVPIDADLQDPPELIAELLAKWRQGFDMVIAVRRDRASDRRHVTVQLRAKLWWQLAKFGFVGTLATLVHTACFVMFIDLAGLPAVVANLAAFAIAFVVSFTGHFTLTFRDRSRRSSVAVRPAVLKFAVAALIGLTLNTAIAYGIVDLLGLSHYLAAALMLVIVPGVVFVLSRNWAFA
jgi:glycosyltransferase involved in cell wall biosynthesis